MVKNIENMFFKTIFENISQTSLNSLDYFAIIYNNILLSYKMKNKMRLFKM